MGAKTELDFTELLDDLLAASAQAEEADEDGVAAPSLRVDMLAQIERLRTQNASYSADRVMREYRENAAGSGARDKPTRDKPKTQASAPDLQPALEDLFFLDPQSISRELGIDAASKPEDLDRARRAFALRYHPDRMPEDQRERAALRMQIANMLIDEAKRRKR